MSHRVNQAVLGLINIYQKYFRLFLPTSCRFVPSCSEYTRQAIIKYGILRGVMKGLKRILICHPFSKKVGFDPLV
ncbi:membrane protein insertion efficiency factor YidD [bacterium]|nr:MAG: membrane protein insertion efficiency factor YidD [bacterium]